jgi:hypothetical protein
MPLTSPPNVFTFAVADVELATSPLPSIRTDEAAATLLAARVEACSDYLNDCVGGISTHPLITAARLAHDQHRPLVLSPDMIWVAILQSFSDHLEANWESLKGRVVASEHPRLTLMVSTDDFPFGSPEAPWAELIADGTKPLHDYVTPEVRALFSMSFSTTQLAQRTAMDVAFLSGLSQFASLLDGFRICGVPSITLEGTQDDWKRILVAMDVLESFDLEWWTSHLRPICEEFVKASEGNPNVEHWRTIATAHSNECSGDDYVTGWIGKLCAYQNRRLGFRQNGLLEAMELGPRLGEFPSGISEVEMSSQRGSIVHLLGGFIGISQNADTLALRPKVGWAVRRESDFESLLSTVAGLSRCEGVRQSPGFNPAAACRGNIMCRVTSRQLQHFYSRYQKLVIRGDRGAKVCTFLPPDQITDVWERELPSFLPTALTDLDRRNALPDLWQRTRGRFQFALFALLPDRRGIGFRTVMSADEEPSWESPAFFLTTQNNGRVILLSNNFADVLRWIIEANDDFLDQAPSYRPIGLVNIYDEEELQRLLRPLNRID